MKSTKAGHANGSKYSGGNGDPGRSCSHGTPATTMIAVATNPAATLVTKRNLIVVPQTTLLPSSDGMGAPLAVKLSFVETFPVVLLGDRQLAASSTPVVVERRARGAPSSGPRYCGRA